MNAGLSEASGRTIERFAAQLGIEARPASDGSYSFRFDRSGDLSFTPSRSGRHVVVNLQCEKPGLDRTSQYRALQMAGPDASTGRFLHVGMLGETGIVLAVVLDESELDLPLIETSIQALLTAQSAL